MLLSASILYSRRQRAILANFALPGDRVFYVGKRLMSRQPFPISRPFPSRDQRVSRFQLTSLATGRRSFGQHDLFTIIKRGE